MSKCILYIDDNPADQRFVQKVLGAHGYQLVVANSGEQGIELAASSTPDLILVDVQMPELNGLETVRRLRDVERCKQTPIVALTAFAEKYQRQTYIDAGFTDYQQKQAGIKPLLALVRLYLSEPHPSPAALRGSEGETGSAQVPSPSQGEGIQGGDQPGVSPPR